MTTTDSSHPQIKPDVQDEDLREAFDYLYKTYFGDSQIEKDEIDRLPEWLGDRDVFFDVGASLGMYTYFANKVMQNGVIYAVEADPDRYAELERNCAQWQEEGSNRIVPLHAAAGDSQGTLTFFKTGSHISGGVFQIPERADNFVEVSVPQIVLDDYYEEGKKFFIKIDVEGAEYRVLSGADRLMKSGQTNLAVGIHSWGDKEYRKTPMSILGLMRRQRMDISKSSNSMTANYLFSPSSKSGAGLWLDYLAYTPMLLGRQLYRQYAPRKLARSIEKLFNARRRKAILKTD